METRQFEMPLYFRGRDYKAEVDITLNREFIVSLPREPYLHLLGYFSYKDERWTNTGLKDQTIIPTQREVNEIGNKILNWYNQNNMKLYGKP